MKYAALFVLTLPGLLSCQSHSDCPAYASVKKRESRIFSKIRRKARKRKKTESGLFTKEQMQVIRSGKKAARQSRRMKKKKS